MKLQSGLPTRKESNRRGAMLNRPTGEAGQSHHIVLSEGIPTLRLKHSIRHATRHKIIFKNSFFFHLHTKNCFHAIALLAREGVSRGVDKVEYMGGKYVKPTRSL